MRHIQEINKITRHTLAKCFLIAVIYFLMFILLLKEKGSAYLHIHLMLLSASAASGCWITVYHWSTMKNEY